MIRRTITIRFGFSMLELLVATALMVSAVTAVGVLLRVNYGAWLEYRSTSLRQESAFGVMRHLVREARQCKEVLQVTGSSDTSGRLSILHADDRILTWDHSGEEVRFGEVSPTGLLGNHITSFTVVGLQKDRVTETNDSDEIHCLQFAVTYHLPERPDSNRTISTLVWIRAF